jgi:hypothetical protein
MLTTGHPRGVSLQLDPNGAQVQGPPPTPTRTGVISRRAARTPAAPASSPPTSPHMGNQNLLVLVELDAFNDRPLDAQQGAP